MEEVLTSIFLRACCKLNEEIKGRCYQEYISCLPQWGDHASTVEELYIFDHSVLYSTCVLVSSTASVFAIVPNLYTMYIQLCNYVDTELYQGCIEKTGQFAGGAKLGINDGALYKGHPPVVICVGWVVATTL